MCREFFSWLESFDWLKTFPSGKFQSLATEVSTDHKFRSFADRKLSHPKRSRVRDEKSSTDRELHRCKIREDFKVSTNRKFPTDWVFLQLKSLKVSSDQELLCRKFLLTEHSCNWPRTSAARKVQNLHSFKYLTRNIYSTDNSYGCKVPTDRELLRLEKVFKVSTDWNFCQLSTFFVLEKFWKFQSFKVDDRVFLQLDKKVSADWEFLLRKSLGEKFREVRKFVTTNFDWLTILAIGEVWRWKFRLTEYSCGWKIRNVSKFTTENFNRSVTFWSRQLKYFNRLRTSTVWKV